MTAPACTACEAHVEESPSIVPPLLTDPPHTPSSAWSPIKCHCILNEVYAAFELRSSVIVVGMLQPYILRVLVLYLLFAELINAAGNSASNKSVTKTKPHRGYYGDSIYEPSQPVLGKERRTTVKPSTKYNGKSNGLSAWGIVGIVLTVILLGVGAYYTVLFYPLLCKKERKYDVIELNAV